MGPLQGKVFKKDENGITINLVGYKQDVTKRKVWKKI
jgi:hypothetical protein